MGSAAGDFAGNIALMVVFLLFGLSVKSGFYVLLGFGFFLNVFLTDDYRDDGATDH
jgi:hypothetical protein